MRRGRKSTVIPIETISRTICTTNTAGYLPDGTPEPDHEIPFLPLGLQEQHS